MCKNGVPKTSGKRSQSISKYFNLVKLYRTYFNNGKNISFCRISGKIYRDKNLLHSYRISGKTCNILEILPDTRHKDSDVIFLQIYRVSGTSFKSFIYFVLNRRRSYVCNYFGYQYIGTKKDTAPEWNNRFIAFVPFLCSLTSDAATKLKQLMLLESTGSLLFQKSIPEMKEVSGIFVYL